MHPFGIEPEKIVQKLVIKNLNILEKKGLYKSAHFCKVLENHTPASTAVTSLIAKELCKDPDLRNRDHITLCSFFIFRHQY